MRRHPILTAFGVLAGLSLFTAYWPASAIVVGVVAGARATGVDSRAWSLTRRVARAVVRRFQRQRTPPPPAEPPAATAPQPARRERVGPEHSVGLHAREQRQPQPRQRAPRTHRPRVGAGVDGPGD